MSTIQRVTAQCLTIEIGQNLIMGLETRLTVARKLWDGMEDASNERRVMNTFSKQVTQAETVMVDALPKFKAAFKSGRAVRSTASGPTHMLCLIRVRNFPSVEIKQFCPEQKATCGC